MKEEAMGRSHSRQRSNEKKAAVKSPRHQKWLQLQVTKEEKKVAKLGRRLYG